jgi:hypothetical protein
LSSGAVFAVNATCSAKPPHLCAIALLDAHPECEATASVQHSKPRRHERATRTMGIQGKPFSISYCRIKITASVPFIFCPTTARSHRQCAPAET